MMGNKLFVTQFAKSKKHHGIDNVTELQLPDAVCVLCCVTQASFKSVVQTT